MCKIDVGRLFYLSDHEGILCDKEDFLGGF